METQKKNEMLQHLARIKRNNQDVMFFGGGINLEEIETLVHQVFKDIPFEVINDRLDFFDEDWHTTYSKLGTGRSGLLIKSDGSQLFSSAIIRKLTDLLNQKDRHGDIKTSVILVLKTDDPFNGHKFEELFIWYPLGEVQKISEVSKTEINWRELYITFKNIWNRYSLAHENPNIGRGILKDAFDPMHSFEEIHEEIQSFNLNLDLLADWPAITQIRDVYEELSSQGFSEEKPASSVYQVGIQVMKLQLEDALDSEGKPRWFYRGQRSIDFTTEPKIFRELPDTKNEAEEELKKRFEQSNKAIAALARKFPEKDEYELLAIAQHYSKELKVSTWLLDVTTSPYIALFFATDDGKEKHIGVLEYIERVEWLFFSHEGNNEFGALRYICPTGIPRIENQRAFFIEAPHPMLYKQLSVRKFFFRQELDVIFEDDELNPPVLQDTIYPQNDPVLEMLPRDWKLSEPTKQIFPPLMARIRLPDTKLFMSIVEPWISDLSDQEKLAALAFCKLHAEITARHIDKERQTNLPHRIGTLHHLRAVMMYLANETQQEALHYYIQNLKTKIEAEEFLECVVVASPAWEEHVRNKLRNVLKND